MASIAGAVARIKQDALGALGEGVVEGVCAEFGHVWRDRELDPATTAALFVQQVLNGNVPCSEVRHLAGRCFTPSAYCQARARLPLAVVQSLLTRVCDAALAATAASSTLPRAGRTRPRGRTRSPGCRGRAGSSRWGRRTSSSSTSSHRAGRRG